MTPSIDTVTERGASEVRAQHERWLGARARLMGGKPPKAKSPALARMQVVLDRVNEPPKPFEPIKFRISAVDSPLFPKWKRIALEVCDKHEITLSELCSSQRSTFLVIARHEAFFRLKTETEMSLPQIGRRIGNKDHTTVLHGLRKHCARNGLPDPFPTNRRVVLATRKSPRPALPKLDVEAWNTLGAPA